MGKRHLAAIRVTGDDLDDDFVTESVTDDIEATGEPELGAISTKKNNKKKREKLNAKIAQKKGTNDSDMLV